MRKDVFRILKNIWKRRVTSQSQSIDFDPSFDFLWNHRRKRWDNIIKIIFLETREKEENFDLNIVIFRAQLDLLWFFKSQWIENTKIKVSVKIF